MHHFAALLQSFGKSNASIKLNLTSIQPPWKWEINHSFPTSTSVLTDVGSLPKLHEYSEFVLYRF